MPFINVEIKACCRNAGTIRNFLQSNDALFKGVDDQTDTYFNVSTGRLKLREGSIEKNLIYYERNNQAGPKDSNFHLMSMAEPDCIKEILSKAIGVKVVVRKKREIYYINNVKFHLDQVEGLGAFIEIEAGNLLADLSKEELLEQCKFYMEAFAIQKEDLVEVSYSDMLLAVT